MNRNCVLGPGYDNFVERVFLRTFLYSAFMSFFSTIFVGDHIISRRRDKSPLYALSCESDLLANLKEYSTRKRSIVLLLWTALVVDTPKDLYRALGQHTSTLIIAILNLAGNILSRTVWSKRNIE